MIGPQVCNSSLCYVKSISKTNVILSLPTSLAPLGLAPSHEAFTEFDPPIVGTDLQQRKRGLYFASLHRFPDFPPRPTFSPDLFLSQPGWFQGTLGQEAGDILSLEARPGGCMGWQLEPWLSRGSFLPSD